MSDGYKFIRAIVDGGALRWEYQIDVLHAPQGGMSHDEDVSDCSTDEIVSLTRQMLDLSDSQDVEVCYR